METWTKAYNTGQISTSYICTVHELYKTLLPLWFSSLSPPPSDVSSKLWKFYFSPDLGTQKSHHPRSYISLCVDNALDICLELNTWLTEWLENPHGMECWFCYNLWTLVFNINKENVEGTFAEPNAQVSGILDTQNNM